jgi:hypothetical protein
MKHIPFLFQDRIFASRYRDIQHHFNEHLSVYCMMSFPRLTARDSIENSQRNLVFGFSSKLETEPYVMRCEILKEATKRGVI